METAANLTNDRFFERQKSTALLGAGQKVKGGGWAGENENPIF